MTTHDISADTAPSLASRAKTYAPHVIAVIASLVFISSLQSKFANAPEAQTIFGTLDNWAASFGAGGLFAPTGLFGQYVIGTAELVASVLLLVGILPALRRLQALGAVVALAVMTGAVSFHLFTPLGIDPNNDGGGLFMMAVTVWVLSIAMLVIRRRDLAGLAGGLKTALLPKS